MSAIWNVAAVTTPSSPPVHHTHPIYKCIDCSVGKQFKMYVLVVAIVALLSSSSKFIN